MVIRDESEQTVHMLTFAETLKRRAKALGLKDAEIARRVGVSARRYGHWTLDRGEPNLELFVAICRELSITPNQALGIEPIPEMGDADLNSALASLSEDEMQAQQLIDALVKLATSHDKLADAQAEIVKNQGIIIGLLSNIVARPEGESTHRLMEPPGSAQRRSDNH
jgi:transcriptional regulator with XRE-family HTH domain